ncbi:pyridoxine 5'-phosphate synthase [Brevundimonas sp. S30B]|uniref:pyridoxine 5'-phosphate synthase n=1 Tax=unclassified Brevundimonas TaxID=2622653 RepID=UPI001071F5FF|nr:MULTISPECIES: pyridoxine 5'-phosphate synthase [unclassified Brevundimonas]QBX37521.1 pyridoxine 5'-phosphate synthase [Brevundimonas sp. MF30-B]TFW03686.1 pyridoxine 5'-phosphate synthase [Brevundimonas sp. S30B]
MSRRVRLGVNIDHVATVRNARGGNHPDPARAAETALAAGADGVTAHLREDRRHITDADIDVLTALCRRAGKPLNLEMAVTDEMLAIALRHRPHAACLVPERREEVTTEGGLAVAGCEARIAPVVQALAEAGMRVSLFIEPSPAQVEAAAAVGAQVVEFHTGRYCHLSPDQRPAELGRLAAAAAQAQGLGLEVHAGHGLDFGTAGEVLAIPEIVELNIGHFLIGEAVFTGLDGAIRRMRAAMDEAVAGAMA